MHAVRCFLLVTLLLAGCSDRGTARGPSSAPAVGPAAAEATPPAPVAHAVPAVESTPEPASSPAAAAGGAGDDDDSSGPAAPAAAAPVEASVAGATAQKELLCDDRKDNDGDRAVDCDDTDCWSVPACEAPEPGDWADQGPGPDQGADGEQAPGPEGADGGPRKPEDDGVGVGCADYIGCVCGVAEAEGGREIGGYSHAIACAETKVLIGNEVEEYCGEELDKLKDVLAVAAEDYAAAKITLPASCN